VDDDPGDQELTRRALADGPVRCDLHVTSDGIQALDFMRHRGVYRMAPRPDIVLLDLNMPRMDGRRVLECVRNDPALCGIPVVVLTTSKQEEDIVRSYELGCNSFITKPVDMPQFVKAVADMGQYWFELVTLPYGVEASCAGA